MARFFSWLKIKLNLKIKCGNDVINKIYPLNQNTMQKLFLRKKYYEKYEIQSTKNTDECKI